MCYHDYCASLEEVFKGSRYLFFAITIECSCRLIEEDDLWVFEKYFRYSEALFLSSTQPYATLSYLGIDSVFELIDEVAFSETESFFERKR